MLTQEQIYQTIEFLLLSILIFDDFHLSDECINLLVKNPSKIDSIEYFLTKLQELTQLEFYMLRLKGVHESLDLYCHSDPLFFSKLRDYCSLQHKINTRVSK